MKALIPLKDGMELHRKVLYGLANQTVPLEPVCVSRPQRDDPSQPDQTKGLLSITECRNILRDCALKNWPDDEYFLMMNRDVILKSDTVQRMIQFLSVNQDHGAVCCWTRDYQLKVVDHMMHVDIACILIRNSSLRNIKFHNDCGCNCLGVCADFKKLDLKIGYLTDHTVSEGN